MHDTCNLIFYPFVEIDVVDEVLGSDADVVGVDIGLAQLAMHSSFETAGASDLEDLVKAIKEFYNSHLTNNKDGELSYELCK